MQASHLPIDILNKTFPRRLRGFDRSAVSTFLEEVASSMEDVIARNSLLEQRLQTAEDELAAYRGMEKTLNEALVVAQKTAEEITLNAHKQAELLLAQARREGEDVLRCAKEDVSSLQRQIDELGQLKQRFLAEFRGLLTSLWELAQNNRALHPALPLLPGNGAHTDAQQGLPLPSKMPPW